MAVMVLRLFVFVAACSKLDFLESNAFEPCFSSDNKTISYQSYEGKGSIMHAVSSMVWVGTYQDELVNEQ